MRPVTRGELLGLEEYERVRDPFRERIRAAKLPGYVALGPNMTVLFENRDTVLLQIQEMLRTERITQEKAIQHELDTYNELVPGERELSASIFVEYPDPAERDRMLGRLAGLAGAFYLALAGERAGLVPDARDTDPARTLAVHYVKFALSDGAWRALAEGRGPVVLGVDHAAYRAECTLSEPTLASLRDDMAG